MRLFTSDQIIKIINDQSQNLDYYLIEVADKIAGYRICAATDISMPNGLETCVIFKQDILHLSRFYSREEVGNLIRMLSTIRQNISQYIPNLRENPYINNEIVNNSDVLQDINKEL